MLFQSLAHRLKLAISPETKSQPLPTTRIPSAQDNVDYTPLEQLQRQRQQLEVSIQGEREHYQSMILAVDVARGLVWIDELFPRPKGLTQGSWLTLRHHRGGEVLTLRSPLVASGERYNTHGLALLLPDNLSYLPRRETPRHDLRRHALAVKIRPLGEDYRHGTIINLSLGGMHLALPGNHLSHMRRDMLLPACEFTLGNDCKIRCEAVVKSARLIRSPYRHTQVSLEFADMMSDRQVLQRHLLQLDQVNRSQAA